jgi:6-phosphogluconolactonase
MLPASPDVRILPDGDAVFDAAAAEITRALAEAVASRGRADWATTGGSAAPPIYRRLADPGRRGQVDWTRVHTWWGDDRFVRFDHELSNVRPLHEIPLGADGPPSGLLVPAQVHPFPIPETLDRGDDNDACAARYAEELRDAVPERDANGTPVLDLVLLGVGPDGHILSVFPDSDVWDVEAIATGVPAPTHVEPHVERVTLHPRMVAAARAVLLVSTGSGKAGPLAKAWADGDAREIPARAAKRAGATWLLDDAAAAQLPSIDR